MRVFVLTWKIIPVLIYFLKLLFAIFAVLRVSRLNSQKHKKRLSEFDSSLIEPSEMSKMYFKCEICNVTCNGSMTHVQHLAGVKHQKTLKRMKMMKMFQSSASQSEENKTEKMILKDSKNLQNKPSIVSVVPFSAPLLRIKTSSVLVTDNKCEKSNVGTVEDDEYISKYTNIENPHIFSEDENKSELKTSNNPEVKFMDMLDDKYVESFNVHMTEEFTSASQELYTKSEKTVNEFADEPLILKTDVYVNTAQTKVDKQSCLYDNTGKATCNNNEVEKHCVDNSINPAVNGYFINLINYEEQVDVLKSQLTEMKNPVTQQYPEYAKYFNKVYKKYGNDFCKIEKAFSATIGSQRQNKWKFKCIRFPFNNDDLIQNVNSKANIKYVWKIRSNLAPTVNVEMNSPYPYFIINIIKVLEEFFNRYETLFPKNYNYNIIDVLMQSNSKNDIMVTVTVYDDSTDLYNHLQDFVYKNFLLMMNLKSLYYIIDVFGNINLYRKIILFGEEKLDDAINGIKYLLSPEQNISINYNYLENLSKVIEDYLLSYKDTVLFELNCKTGLPLLSLSLKFKEVYGFGDSKNIQEIEKIRLENNVQNATFDTDEIKCTTELSLKIHNFVPISAIINSDQPCKNFKFVLDKLIKFPMLKRLVFITESLDRSRNTLLTIMASQNSSLFVPISCSIVDKLLENNSCDYVILMERRPLTESLLIKKSNRKSKDIDSATKTQNDSLISSDTELENELLNSIPLENGDDKYDEDQNTFLPEDQINLIDLISESSSDIVELTNSASEAQNKPSDMLLDYIFHELTQTLPEVEEIKHDQVTNNESPVVVDNYIRTPIEVVTSDTEVPQVISSDNNRVNIAINKTKIINYLKKLQQKLKKVIIFMNNNTSHDLDLNTLMEVKLLSSYMLKTGKKMQEKLRTSSQSTNIKNPVMLPEPYISLLNPRLYYGYDMHQNTNFTNISNGDACMLTTTENDCNLENVPMEISSPTKS